MEVIFHTWEWEEQVEKLSLEQVGLGKINEYFSTFITYILCSGLIINAVGLGISILVFVIEKIIHKTIWRGAAHATQNGLEVEYLGWEAREDIKSI